MVHQVITTCLPVILHRKFLARKFSSFSAVLQFEDITNTDYAGEIENFGDTVRIIKDRHTVSSYARGSVVNPQDLADDQITRLLTKSFRV